jgi:predicted transcriptional regulator
MTGSTTPVSTRGRGRPSEGTRIDVRLPAELLADIDYIAAKTGSTRATVIRDALNEWTHGPVVRDALIR